MNHIATSLSSRLGCKLFVVRFSVASSLLPSTNLGLPPYRIKEAVGKLSHVVCPGGPGDLLEFTEGCIFLSQDLLHLLLLFPNGFLNALDVALFLLLGFQLQDVMILLPQDVELPNVLRLVTDILVDVTPGLWDLLVRELHGQPLVLLPLLLGLFRAPLDLLALLLLLDLLLQLPVMLLNQALGRILGPLGTLFQGQLPEELLSLGLAVHEDLPGLVID